MIRGHASAVRVGDLPGEALKEGDVGTVAHDYGDGVAYEVAFVTLGRGTVTVVTLEKGRARPGKCHEMHPARPLESSA